jgi:hypothetical protein
MYLTYEEYMNMGGTLDQSAFNDFEFEAEAQIDWFTFNRLHNQKTYPEAVSRCVYALIKLCALKANAMNLGDTGDESSSGTISSQSNDGVSVSYNVLSASEAFKLCSDEVGNTIKRYLQGVTNELGRKILYRGLYPGE